MYSQEETLRSTIDKSLKVIRLYDWLLNLYVLDFFVDNHWTKLPLSWQECFQNITPQDLGNILSEVPTKHVLPLSFISLIKAVKSLSLPRDKISNKNKIGLLLSEDICNGHPRLKNLFLKHVKLKKRHEICLMSKVVSGVAVESKCDAVVDFGSGLGHLVRVLAYNNNLYAAGIECQSQLTEEARSVQLVHAYRAALERILVDYDPKLKHAPVRNIKHSDTMTFQQYSTQALSRLNIPLPACFARGEADLRQWRRVVTLYTLRLALAPLVETVILLDRVLYILEHGLSCEIHPVFDPKLSPRNHIIVGKRL
ncbi:methyltransferase-like protein 25B isoform X3 [Choristoneura fumiferana]|uniref:methyltransferase-like protein 25B isoform X3 n=1 Tax=Choristoneura fumiferana TaxID=7141 RepID=UPI003D156B2B